MQYPNVRLARVLQLINRAREACGLEALDSIPRGMRKKKHNCPLAVAFHDLGPNIKVSQRYLTGVSNEHGEQLARVFRTECSAVNTDTRMVQLPPLLQNFILNFDGGAYDKLALEAC